jgi:2-ketocyclohexanecarboxyl-CoA hydrolase
MKFEDILYEKKDGIAKVTINRPDVMNAFRAQTVSELIKAFQDAWDDDAVGVVVLTGAGDKAFCTGGDQKSKVGGSYGFRGGEISHFHSIIRQIPKPVIAAVNGYAIGGGHVFHVICDLSIASDKAVFGQVGPKFGSVDPGFGTAYLSRIVGEKRAREIWYLCRRYKAQEALEMGLVNKVVPHDKLEEEVEAWCKEILAMSPTALRIAKSSFNADSDNIYGIEGVGYSALDLYWNTEESAEGTNAFVEKRAPEFRKLKGIWNL